MARQSERCGVEMLQATAITAVRREPDILVVHISTRHVYRTDALLIATGSTYHRIGDEHEADLIIGARIHFCATRPTAEIDRLTRPAEEDSLEAASGFEPEYGALQAPA